MSARLIKLLFKLVFIQSILAQQINYLRNGGGLLPEANLPVEPERKVQLNGVTGQLRVKSRLQLPLSDTQIAELLSIASNINKQLANHPSVFIHSPTNNPLSSLNATPLNLAASDPYPPVQIVRPNNILVDFASAQNAPSPFSPERSNAYDAIPYNLPLSNINEMKSKITSVPPAGQILSGVPPINVFSTNVGFNNLNPANNYFNNNYDTNYGLKIPRSAMNDLLENSYSVAARPVYSNENTAYLNPNTVALNQFVTNPQVNDPSFIASVPNNFLPTTSADFATNQAICANDINETPNCFAANSNINNVLPCYARMVTDHYRTANSEPTAQGISFNSIQNNENSEVSTDLPVSDMPSPSLVSDLSRGDMPMLDLSGLSTADLCEAGGLPIIDIRDSVTVLTPQQLQQYRDTGLLTTL